eukprot:scaffold100656_cov29-Phaeocystis_antarctica.AAC.1
MQQPTDWHREALQRGLRLVALAPRGPTQRVERLGKRGETRGAVGSDTERPRRQSSPCLHRASPHKWRHAHFLQFGWASKRYRELVPAEKNGTPPRA